MEEKNNRISKENPMESTDDTVLKILWADKRGNVSWKRKSPFGKPAVLRVQDAAQEEEAPELPIPAEEALSAPVMPPAKVAEPAVEKKPQAPVEMPRDEKELWPLEGKAVSWKRKSPFGQPAVSGAQEVPQEEATSEPAVLEEKMDPVPVAPPKNNFSQAASSMVQPHEPKPDPVLSSEKPPKKQSELWETKKRTPAISGSAFGNGDGPHAEKEYPASLWGREKSPAVGKESAGVSASVWGKHTGQRSTRSSAVATIWGKKALNAERVCPQCGTPNPKDARFCCMCRASLQEKTCSACGKAITLTQARYCPFCGADL